MFRSLLLVGYLSLFGCSTATPVGLITANALRATAPSFARIESVDAEAQQRLAEVLRTSDPAEVTVYFGDWCHDSVREVPRLLALVERFPSLQLTLINLDRNKRDPEGHAEAANITRTPTIVVSRNGQELGRIVERPRITLAQDLIALLQQGG